MKRTYQVAAVHGWAVFRGTDGDAPELVAFFAGEHAQPAALEFLEASRDPDVAGYAVVRAMGGLVAAMEYATGFRELADAIRLEAGEFLASEQRAGGGFGA